MPPKRAFAAGLCWWLALRHLPVLHDGLLGRHQRHHRPANQMSALPGHRLTRPFPPELLIGALLGFAFSLFGSLPWNFILAVFFAVIVSGLFNLRNSSRLAGVTIAIIMLVPKAGPRWYLALDRVGEVLLGIVVALAVTTLILPDRARLWLRDGLAQEFLLLGEFFESILEGFRGTPSQNLPALHAEVQALIRANSQLLDAARNEPTGPGRVEGLTTLSQFGRSLFDALVALEFSVKDSHEDRFAQQLEPALQHLAIDIRTGLNHMAGCIHKWRFNASSQGTSLEQDIADLEARMEVVRYTGIEFSQAEILRAYALQLHLKQIARLLHALRIETSRAVGEPGKIVDPA